MTPAATDRMLSQPPQQLHRARYKTLDADEADSWSATFPAENPARRIIAVDWSTPGEVEVTWLITAVT